MANTGLHISLSAEPVFHIGGVTITNSILTSLIVSGLLISFALMVNKSLKKTDRPTGLQNFAEMIIESLYQMVHSVTGDKKKTRQFFPFVASFFLFIIMNNYLGLLPGVGTIGFYENEEEIHVQEEIEEHSSTIVPQANAEEHQINDQVVIEKETDHQLEKDEEPIAIEEDLEHLEEETHGPVFVPLFRAGTADLNTTIALGLVSIFLTQFIGVKNLGLSYFKKFFDFSSPINAYVGLLEMISEFAKIISFAFRLFGNIFAGEVLLAVIGFLVPVIAPMPFYGLELFVGFIQALVFAMLSLVFFNMATLGHDDH